MLKSNTKTLVPNEPENGEQDGHGRSETEERRPRFLGRIPMIDERSRQCTNRERDIYRSERDERQEKDERDGAFRRRESQSNFLLVFLAGGRLAIIRRMLAIYRMTFIYASAKRGERTRARLERSCSELCPFLSFLVVARGDFLLHTLEFP